MYVLNFEKPILKTENDQFAGNLFLLIAIAVSAWATLSFFLFPLPTFQWFSDYWEHASALRVLAENPLAPTNPHYVSHEPDRQFIPMFVFLGWVMKLTGISVVAALGIAGVITTILFFVGVSTFAKAYFAHRFAPVVTVTVLLCCWGTPWVWAGFYELRAHFYNAFYPVSFVFSLTFLAWAIVIRSLKQNSLSTGQSVALLLLAWLMFVSHQLGGLFAIGGAVLFLIFDEPKATVKLRLKVFLILVAGVALTWWWPYFNPVQLMFNGSGDKANEGVPAFYDTVQVLLLIGPALLGIPVLFVMFRKRANLSLAVGFISLLLAYVGGGIVGHPVAHRFLSYLILYLHLAIIWKLLSIFPNGKQELRDKTSALTLHFTMIFGLLLVVAQFAFGVTDFARLAYENFTGKSFGSFPSQPVMKELSAVANAIPNDAVLFATSGPALSITALKGKVVARPRPQLMIANGPQRAEDNRVFFSRKVSRSERLNLLERYSVTHILIRRADIPDSVTAELQRLGETVLPGGQLVLIKITGEVL